VKPKLPISISIPAAALHVTAREEITVTEGAERAHLGVGSGGSDGRSGSDGVAVSTERVGSRLPRLLLVVLFVGR